MIVVYTSPGCASCRKVKSWLKDHNLKFVEKNIFKTLLDPNEISYILARSENGTDDIISKRSKLIQQNHVDIDSMTTKELVSFIQKNPSILKRPIILSEKTFQVGYDEEEMDAFTPAELRSYGLKACSPDCPNYEGCGKVRENDK